MNCFINCGISISKKLGRIEIKAQSKILSFVFVFNKLKILIIIKYYKHFINISNELSGWIILVIAWKFVLVNSLIVKRKIIYKNLKNRGSLLLKSSSFFWSFWKNRQFWLIYFFRFYKNLLFLGTLVFLGCFFFFFFVLIR